MNNEESKIPPVKSVAEAQRLAIENRAKVARQQLERQGKIIESFLPAISAASPRLVDSNNATQGLGEIIQFVLNAVTQRMTLKDIGVIAELDKYINADPMKTETRESKFVQQKKIVQQLEDWTVADVLFALSWYGVQAKVFIDKEIADVDLSKLVDGTKSLLDSQFEKLKQDEELILSPLQKTDLEGPASSSSTA